jgi:hypothetical protein
LELSAKPQYVLWRVTVRLSPTWSVTVCPFAASAAVIAAAGRGEGVLPDPAPEGLAEGPGTAPQAVARAQSAADIAIAAFDLMWKVRRRASIGSEPTRPQLRDGNC